MISLVWFLLVTLVVASSVVDAAVYRIPNSFVLALILAFAAMAAVHAGEVAWLAHTASFGIVFGVGLVLYFIGQMGAGDVKFLGALALWAGLPALPVLLFWVAICGIVVTPLILILRRIVPGLVARKLLPPKTENLRVFAKRNGIPYAVAIGPGAIIASFSFPSWLWSL